MKSEYSDSEELELEIEQDIEECDEEYMYMMETLYRDLMNYKKEVEIPICEYMTFANFCDGMELL